MKQEDNIEGLNRRHIAQIIRRNMITKKKESAHIYKRKPRTRKYEE
jgi:hypothetical protein